MDNRVVASPNLVFSPPPSETSKPIHPLSRISLRPESSTRPSPVWHHHQDATTKTPPIAQDEVMPATLRNPENADP